MTEKNLLTVLKHTLQKLIGKSWSPEENTKTRLSEGRRTSSSTLIKN